jgi:hypothetical protein
MEGNGRTLVVSGFGFSKGAAGGGKRIAVVTGGTVLRAGTLHVRRGHLPVGGSRFLALRLATVQLLLLTVGAVSTDRSSRPPKRIAGRGVVNATVLEKKRSGIVLLNRLVGAVSTDRSFRPPRRIADRGVVNATVPEKKRSGIVPE